MLIWKYKSDGSLDTSFSDDGIVIHHNAAGGSYHDYGTDIAIDSSGYVYISWYSWNDISSDDMVIWKYK